MEVHEHRLATGGLVLADGDARQAAPNEVEFLHRLVLAVPLAKVSTADVHVDGFAGIVAPARERKSVVDLGHNVMVLNVNELSVSFGKPPEQLLPDSYPAGLLFRGLH